MATHDLGAESAHATPKSDWIVALETFKLADDDLNDPDIESDVMINHYSQIREKALRDFLLIPCASPAALQAKLSHAHENMIWHARDDVQRQVMAALLRDLNAIGKEIWWLGNEIAHLKHGKPFERPAKSNPTQSLGGDNGKA